jgi:hypothetical protein
MSRCRWPCARRSTGFPRTSRHGSSKTARSTRRARVESTLDNANLLAAPFTIPTTALGALSSSAYKLGGNYQKCPITANLGNGGTPNLYPILWLVIGVPAGFTGSHQLILDRIKLNDGAQPSTFTPAIGETPGVADPDSLGIVPGNVGDLPDAVYIPSGDLGGFSAQGGLFQ